MMNHPLLPVDFNCEKYKMMHIDLQWMSDTELIQHYLIHGIREGRKYKSVLANQIYFPRLSGGVNLLGYVNSLSGLGISCRTIEKSLKALGIPYYLNEYPLPLDAGAFRQVSDKSQYGINIICMNPDIGYDGIDSTYFKDKINIALIFWELEELPELWQRSLQFFDEIWVTSLFNVETMQAYLPGKNIYHLPVPSDHVILLDQQECKKQYNISSETFLCLFIFDYRSDMYRKNPLAIIRAFKMAFTEIDNCQLIIKTHHFPVWEEQLIKNEIAGHPGIIFFNREMSAEERDALMNACDLYISLHRSEGFGMTIMEALLLGKPVVCTNYSGNLDFCDASWCELVNYEMVAIHPQSVYARNKGCENSKWADPDIEDAARKIRNVRAEYDLHVKKSMKGKAWIEKRYNLTVLNEQLGSRLEYYNGY